MGTRVQSIDAFLTKAREHLRITNHANILEAVRTDLERIRYVSIRYAVSTP